ncbi:MAG: cyclic nucleotide-binding/CBS domain-containing protein [Promethearchaeota archaeon]
MASNQKGMKTTFKDISSTHIYFCHEEDMVSTIAQKMRDYWTDTIFVTNKQNQVTGIITDGIIWNLIAKENDPIDPRTLKAKEIMFKNFTRVNCNETIESIEKLRELLEKTKIQRIALVKDGQIVGLVRKKFIERVKRYARKFSFSWK